MVALLPSRVFPRVAWRARGIGVERLTSHGDDCSLLIRLCQSPALVFSVTLEPPQCHSSVTSAEVPRARVRPRDLTRRPQLCLHLFQQIRRHGGRPLRVVDNPPHDQDLCI